jgi:hypothetical protein
MVNYEVDHKNVHPVSWFITPQPPGARRGFIRRPPSGLLLS